MTTTVTVQAHCSENTEVVVMLSSNDDVDTTVLQDGQSIERYIYDDRAIVVRERGKAEEAPVLMDESPIISDECPGAESAPDDSTEPSTDVAPTRDTDDAVPA